MPSRLSPFKPATPVAANRMLELLLGYACAAKCPFCYNPPLTPGLLAGDLSFQQACEILYRKRKEGFDGVWLTGGEVTQRPDLPRILAAARKLSYGRIQIGSNGLRTADQRYASLLARSGLNYARLSIHAAKASVHDRILGLPGSFAKAVASIETLRGAGVSVGINFVLCRWNLKELPAFLDMAGECGVEDVDVLFPHYRGMMELNAGRVGITYTEAAASVTKALAVKRSWQPHLINFPPCVLPAALAPLICDWRKEGVQDHRLARPDGESDLAQMKAGQKRQGPACRRCVLSKDCMGFEAEYAARCGEAEFRPLIR